MAYGAAAVRELAGAYYVATSDGTLIQLNTAGGVQWSHVYCYLFNSLEVTSAGQLLLGGRLSPGLDAAFMIIDSTGAIIKAKQFNGPLGFGSIQDSLGNIITFGNMPQAAGGSRPWAAKVDPTGTTILSQLYFNPPLLDSGEFTKVVESPPGSGSYVLIGDAGLGNTYYTIVFATGTDLSLPTYTKQLPNANYDVEGLVALAAGGVAIVGQVRIGTTVGGYLLQLDILGAFVQARTYTDVAGLFDDIALTTTPGFVISGFGQQPWVLSTKADGTVAGTCESGFGSSTTIPLSAFPVTKATSPVTTLQPGDTTTNYTVTITAVTDNYTFTAQCH